MKIGIVGSGQMGSALGVLWAAKGHHICFSYSRNGVRRLQNLVEAAGSNSKVCTLEAAIETSDVILLALPWAAITDAVVPMRDRLTGKVLLTCVLPVTPDYRELVIAGNMSGSEEIQRLVPDTTLVYALPVFADLLYAAMQTESQSVAALYNHGEPLGLYCGDNSKAKATAALLLAEIGMRPINVGPLRSARLIEPLGLLMAQLAFHGGIGTDIALGLLQADVRFRSLFNP